MANYFQVILLLIIIVLSVITAVIGIQISLTLVEIRKFVKNLGLISDKAVQVTLVAEKGATNLKSFLYAIKSSFKMVNFIKEKIN